MSENTAHAACGTMPAERPTHLALLDVVDEINIIRLLNDAAFAALGE
jgi:hypothetical protein